MIVTGMVGHWYRLPTGRIAQVREVTQGWKPEVSLRVLDEEGAMTAVEFSMSLASLLLHALHVDVAQEQGDIFLTATDEAVSPSLHMNGAS